MTKTVKNYLLIYGVILAFLFCLSLYIRAALPYNSVFGGEFVQFGGNDPWYHLRMVELTVLHFPHRPFFDPFTHFPLGDRIHFGPFFDQMIAFCSLVVGLGSPTQHTIEVVHAFFPTILGALVVFPVYFIGKEVFDDRRVGILSAALIVIIPGQFLSRSLLGFTDHHVAETLFSTLAIMFLIFAIKRARENGLKFEHILDRNGDILKSPLLFAMFSGIMLGCYLLSWMGAPLLMVCIIIFALLQFVSDYAKNISSEYLCIVGTIALIIPALMAIPYVGKGPYTWFHVASFALGGIVFLVLGMIPKIMNRVNLKRYLYPLLLILIGFTGIAISYLLIPDIINIMVSSFKIFSPQGGALTVAEVAPLFSRPGLAYGNFTTSLFFMFISLALLGYAVIREWKAEKTLFFVWSIFMIWITLRQNRFAYYSAVNASILTGFFAWKMLDWGGFGKLYEDYLAKREKKAFDLKRFIQRNLKISHFMVVIIVILFVFYPNIGIAMNMARSSGGPDNDWHDSLVWLSKNTPEPGLDYYAFYEAPQRGESYAYPDSTYGVMSWWDYGHWITTIGRRIPNANPFQHGIGGAGPNGTVRPGAATYFINTDETDANKMLDELGTKYIISDFMMADQWNSYYNKYHAMVAWAERNPPYYNTMEARLHMFDGSQTIVENKTIPALKHYRLVYESDRFIIPFMIINPIDQSGIGWRSNVGDYLSTTEIAKATHLGARDKYGDMDVIIYTPDYISPVSYIKIFEYVPGANIVMDEYPGVTTANISIDVTTNSGRSFTYTQTVEARDGKFIFTVPYSTEGPTKGGTQFDVAATSHYLVSAETVEKKVAVSEYQVMNGEIININ